MSQEVTRTRPSQTKPRARRSKADDDATAANPDILCHQIGLCKNLAELQAFIAKHNLLNVETDPRFDDRMKVVVEEALDTMAEVLQNPDAETAALFPVPADLAAKGWVIERDGVGFLFRRGQLATSQYVIRSEAAEAARKLHAREGRRGGGAPPPDGPSDEVAVGGHDRRGPAYWRGQADAMTKRILDKLRPYDAPGKKTLHKIELYENRVRDGLDWQQWQCTLVNFADALEAGELPAILRGLTNDTQVRRLMCAPYQHQPFTNMGPTVKTFEDFVAAHEALKPLIPAKLEDPNLDPRTGTEWTVAINAEDGEAGSHAAGDEGAARRAAAAAGSDSGVVEVGFVSSHRRAELDAACGPCGHSTEEHDAFDAGLVAGEAGWPESSCLITDSSLRLAWLSGFDVGVSNRGASASPEASEGSAYEGQDAAALLEATEREQRGHWQTLVALGFERDKAKGKKRDRLDGEIKGLRDIYVAMWSELSDATSPQISNDLRNRVEGLEPPPVSADPATSGDVVESTPVTDAQRSEPHLFRETVEVKLNDSDVALKARKAAAIEVQIEELETEMKKTADGYKQRIGGLREEHRELMRAIVRGHDELDLDVYERRDYERHVVETVRADSHEVVGSRAMRPTEYQQPLPSL